MAEIKKSFADWYGEFMEAIKQNPNDFPVSLSNLAIAHAMNRTPQQAADDWNEGLI